MTSAVVLDSTRLCIIGAAFTNLDEVEPAVHGNRSGVGLVDLEKHLLGAAAPGFLHGAEHQAPSQAGAALPGRDADRQDLGLPCSLAREYETGSRVTGAPLRAGEETEDRLLGNEAFKLAIPPGAGESLAVNARSRARILHLDCKDQTLGGDARRD
jgi:hypothetical protein